MALYTMEEICKGCQHAVFHECCGAFCRCRLNRQSLVNGVNGTCAAKCIPGSDSTSSGMPVKDKGGENYGVCKNI